MLFCLSCLFDGCLRLVAGRLLLICLDTYDALGCCCLWFGVSFVAFLYWFVVCFLVRVELC